MHRSEVQKVWIIASLQTLIPHGSGAGMFVASALGLLT
jgi:hypothetical protein